MQKTNIIIDRICQTQGLLGDGESAFEKAQDIILRWGQTRGMFQLPEEAFSGKPFDIELYNGSSFRAESTKDVWTMSLALPDASSRLWTTEATLLRLNGNTHFGMNLVSRYPATDLPPNRSIPAFVRTLSDTFGLYDYNEQLGSTFHTVTDQNEVKELADLIRERHRTRPVFVMTLDKTMVNPEDALVDPAHVARTVNVLGHCYVLSSTATFLLTKELGQEWGVYNGAIRTYMPGFDPINDTFMRHPLAPPDRVKQWEQNRAGSFAQFALEKAAKLSIKEAGQNRVPSFEEIRSLLLDMKIRSAEEKTAKKKDERDSVISDLMEENKRIKKELLEVWAAYEKSDGALEEAQETIAQQEENIKLLQAQLEQMSKIVKVQASTSVIDAWKTRTLADSYFGGISIDKVGKWSEKNLSERLVLMPSAQKDLIKSKYGSPETVCKALLFLATEVWEKRFEASKDAFTRCDERAKELGFSFRKVPNPTIGKDAKANYFVPGPDGRPQFLDWHLCKGDSRSGENCLRLYLYFDEGEKGNPSRPPKIVIGRGRHLRNTLSK